MSTPLCLCAPMPSHPTPGHSPEPPTPSASLTTRPITPLFPHTATVANDTPLHGCRRYTHRSDAALPDRCARVSSSISGILSSSLYAGTMSDSSTEGASEMEGNAVVAPDEGSTNVRSDSWSGVRFVCHAVSTGHKNQSTVATPTHATPYAAAASIESVFVRFFRLQFQEIGFVSFTVRMMVTAWVNTSVLTTLLLVVVGAWYFLKGRFAAPNRANPDESFRPEAVHNLKQAARENPSSLAAPPLTPRPANGESERRDDAHASSTWAGPRPGESKSGGVTKEEGVGAALRRRRQHDLDSASNGTRSGSPLVSKDGRAADWLRMSSWSSCDAADDVEETGEGEGDGEVKSGQVKREEETPAVSKNNATGGLMFAAATIDDNVAAITPATASVAAAALSTTDAAPLRACARCGQPVVKRLRCSRCKEVYYCSPYCQREAWSTHKPACHKRSGIATTTSSSSSSSPPPYGDDPEGPAKARIKEGTTSFILGNYRSALVAFEEARGTYEGGGGGGGGGGIEGTGGEAHVETLRMSGLCYEKLRDEGKAEQCLLAALALAQKLDPPQAGLEAEVRIALGCHERRRTAPGSLERAKDMFMRALALAEGAKDVMREVRAFTLMKIYSTTRVFDIQCTIV